ncbi:PQQ-dependent sugar dehydrogenase [Shimia biformata]|uniref:PQQ-dependent sugar dehydrogenase n=1 Tax=Shimia biformata TaxID=1294299 RepID=UPI0030845CD5
MTRLIVLIFLVLMPGVAVAETLTLSAGEVRVQKQAAGLKVPWGIDFLPDGRALVTERGGRLFLLDGQGAKAPVKGVPKVYARGQGGLLDVMVPRDFDRSREVFLTYATKQKGGAGTAVGKGRLSADGRRLEGFRQIFEMAPGSSGGRHFGSRIVEARDGTLFVTIGDRGDDMAAQDLSRHNGSVIRITRDGAPAPGNPFLGRDEAQPEIWSYGHRNPQGATLDLSGRLVVIEHGARGGDEVNRVQKGANYGWPVIAYGRHYSGAKIGEGTAKPGMQQPEFYWDPSIAPSGGMVYSGRLFPRWKGHLFTGSLKFDYLSRLSGSPLKEVERITGDFTTRTRDVAEAPDGAIWVVSEGNGAVYRLSRAR